MANSIVEAFRIYKSDTERKAGGQPVANNSKTVVEKPVGIPVVSNEGPGGDSVEKDSGNIKPAQNELQVIADTGVTVQEPKSPGSKVFYTIQVAAIPNAKPADDSRFSKIPDLFNIVGDDGISRYFSGNYSNLDLARKSLMTMKQQGFKDAFICAFSGARRISIIEAEELLKRK